MTHSANIKAFLSTSNGSQNDLIQAYCGLVAVELALKGKTNFSDHNVPKAMKTLGGQSGPQASRMVLSALAQKLSNQLQLIYVQDRNGKPITAPSHSFPHIRYTRFSGDGWGTPETNPQDLQDLSRLVKQIRTYLKRDHGCDL